MSIEKEISSNTNGFELRDEELDKNSLLNQNDAQNSNHLELQKNGFKLQLVQKLTEIDRRYKQGVLEYKETIQAYNIEIEKLKNKILLAQEVCNKEEKSLLLIEHEILFDNKAYDNLQTKFTQYINSIEELKYEYKDVLDEVHYAMTLKRKEKELLVLLDDIDIIELSLLNKELSRLNTVETFKPKKENLSHLEIALKELEMKKNYFESMGLHKVSNVKVGNENFWKKESPEVVDTVEVEADT